jgi:MFS family permease
MDAMRTRSRTRHVLGSPGFAPLLAGNVLSNTGSFIHVAVTSWLLFELTHRSAMVGLVQLSRSIPLVLLTIPAGVVVDHQDRRRFMLRLEFVAASIAVTLAAVVWAGHVTVWALLATTAALGIVSAFDGPGWISLIGSLLHEDHLLLGFSMNSVSFHLAAALGPPVGALLLAAAGAGWAFFTNGLSYLAIVAALLLVPRAAAAPPVYQGMRQALTEAVAYLRGSRRAKVLIPMGAALSLVVFGIPSILPAMARVLHGGSRTYGTLMGAFGAGNFAGALALGVGSSRVRPRNLMKAGVTTSALGAAGLALARSPAEAAFAMAAMGSGQLVSLVTARTLMLAEAGSELGGRIVGVFMTTTIGIAPLGGIALGWATDAWGIHAAVRIAAGYAACVAAATLAGARPRRESAV